MAAQAPMGAMRASRKDTNLGLARPLPSGVFHPMAKCNAPRTVGKPSSRSPSPTASSSGRLPPSATIFGRAARAEPSFIPPMGAPLGIASASTSRETRSRKPSRAFSCATRSISPSPRLPARNGSAKTAANIGRNTLRPKIEIENRNSHERLRTYCQTSVVARGIIEGRS